MSHAHGIATFADGTRRFFEYDGTSDCVASPALWESPAEVQAHWRMGMERECTCGGHPEVASFHADYGRGIDWEVPACRVCMVILDTRGRSAMAIDRMADEDASPYR